MGIAYNAQLEPAAIEALRAFIRIRIVYNACVGGNYQVVTPHPNFPNCCDVPRLRVPYVGPAFVARATWERYGKAENSGVELQPGCSLFGFCTDLRNKVEELRTRCEDDFQATGGYHRRDFHMSHRYA